MRNFPIPFLLPPAGLLTSLEFFLMERPFPLHPLHVFISSPKLFRQIHIYMYPLVRPRKREKPTTRRKFVNLLPFSALGSSRIPFLPGVCFLFLFRRGCSCAYRSTNELFLLLCPGEKGLWSCFIEWAAIRPSASAAAGPLSLLTVSLFTLLQRVPHIFRVRDSTNRHNRWRGAWPSGVTRLTFTVNDNLFLYTRAV